MFTHNENSGNIHENKTKTKTKIHDEMVKKKD